MADSTRYFKLGAFVIGACAVLVALLVAIGSGGLQRNRVMLETYFDESIQGLDIGSKVKYRGVTVGEVTRISFTSTKYELDKPPTERKQYVLVEVGVRSDLIGGKFALAGERESLISPQIERGLRVRLTSQGVTGTSYLEVDFVDPKNAVPLEISWQPDYLYVPSAPSTVSQLLSALDELVGRVRKLDVEGTVANFNSALVTLSRQIERLPIERLSNDASKVLAGGNALVANAGTLVTELRQSNQRLGQELDKLQVDKLGREAAALIAEVRESNQALQKIVSSPALTKLPEDASAAVARVREAFDNPELGRAVGQLQRTVGRLERLLVGREGDLSTTLENLRVISENLRDTSELARRHPSQLLLGQPPAPARATAQP